MNEEINLLEFSERFNSERACLVYLHQKRWPNGFVCPKCECTSGYWLRTRGDWQCNACRYQVSVTAGTMFHKTHTSLRKWFTAIFLVATDKGGISASRLSLFIEVSYPTAFLMLHKIRHAMAEREQSRQLSGYLEIDEGFFGKRETKRKPDKANNQAQVLVMIESLGRQAGELAMKVIESASRDSLEKIAKEKIEEGQHIRTDGFQSHYVLKSMGHKLNAKPVPAPIASKELPWVHIAIALTKRVLLGTFHGVSKKHLQAYLDEICYRFNRRHKPLEAFSRLLRTSIYGTPFTYNQLVNKA